MHDLNLKELDNSIELDVIAKPKASKDAIVGIHDHALRIAVTAAPEIGKANASIVKILAKSFKVPQSSISIISGETSRRKRVRIDGMTSKQAIEILTEILE